MKNTLFPRPPKWLNTLFLILLILMICFLFNAIGLSFYFLISENSPFTLKVGEMVLQEKNLETFVILIVNILFQAGMVYLFVKIRRLLKLFHLQQLYSVDQVRYLNIIGKTIIILCLSRIAVGITTTAMVEQNVDHAFDLAANNTDFFYLVLGLGFFFVFLGKAFDNARLLKEENELTV